MRLDKLEVKGFKSFRDKTVIEFPDKFTAIVGPNGSGKSNLTEAICFVLGKSRGLRANTLQDLIFNGGMTGGTPASRTAVSLTLTDTYGRKYTITRIADLEGRSIYKLNGERCTRQKIVDIVGDNEYNIILQDDVTAVIKMHNVERRKIIDELCGIAEYDKKKEKALAELKKVEDKISDVHIVIGEKQGYLNRLKNERDDALRYREVQDNLKQAKATLLNHEIEKHEKRLRKHDERISESETEKSGHEKRKNGIQDKIDEERTRLKEINDRIFSLEEGKSRVRWSEINGEMIREEERITSLTDKIGSAEGEIGEATKRRKDVQLDQDKIGEALAEKTRELERMKKEIEAISPAERDSTIDSAIDSIKDELYKLRSQEETLNKLSEGMQEDVQSLGEEKKSLGNRIQKISEEVKTQGTELTEKEDTYEKKHKEQTKLAKEIEDTYKKLEDTRKQLEELRLTHTRKKTELKTIEEAGGGIKGAEKAVMRLADVIPGIHGPVSTLGKVEDPKYETALKVAAGGRIHHIVVDNVDVAAKCIDYLKKKQIGRATFIPLNKINVTVEERIPDGAICFARGHIQADKRYCKVFEYVFGDTVVVDDIRRAEKVGVGKHRMATLDGDLFEKTGSVTGGFVGKTIDVGFSNLEELEKEVEGLLEKITSLENSGEKHELEKSELTSKLNSLGKIDDEKTHINRLSFERKSLLDKKKELEHNVSETEKKIAALLEKSGENTSRVAGIKKGVVIQEERLEKALRERGDQDTSEAERLKDAERDLKIEESGLLENRQNNSRWLGDLKKRLSSLTDEKEKAGGELTWCRNKLVELKKEMTAVERETASLGEEIAHLIDTRGKVEDKIRDLGSQTGEIDYLIGEIRGKMEGVMIEKAKTEAELEGLRKDYSKYEGVDIMELKVKDMDAMIEKLENKLADFGSINMKAIETYDVVKKEFDELVERLDTLKNERQSIYDFMEEVERKKHDTFIKTFTTVKENFEEIFHKLSDGMGTLILDNPKNISESGLLIQASPKGKKIMSLDSLSGGEKTLTTAAFLLAIQQYKPSYFYVVDELDAALDQENSMRLGELMRESDAQFVLVTHNTSMIKHVNSVVGISMSDGISQVVGVRLDEIEGKAA